MKHILFVILLITCSYRVFTQDTVRVQQNELVELQSAIIRHSHKDTIRVHMLTDYANLCFYNLDFLKGFKALSEASIISKQLKFTRGEGLYLKSISIFRRRINAGYAFIKTQDINKVNEVNEAIYNQDIYFEVEGNRVLGQYTDFELFGIIIMPIGIRDSEIEAIISSLEEALSYYAETDNVEFKAYLEDALSFILLNSEKEKSKKHKKAAKDLYQELNWSYHQLFILARDIDNLLKLGLEAEAKPLEIEAINIYTNEADKYIKAHCAHLLSRTYGASNRANLELEYLFQAEELLTDEGEKDLLKPVYFSIAIVYEWYLRNSEKALEYEYKELNLRKEIDFYERIANTYLLISESLFGLKRIQEFPQEYKDYLIVGGVKGSLFFDAELLWVKARMLEAQGKSVEAQSVFQESIGAYMNYNDKHGASWAAFDLAESYKSVGDLKNAIKYAHISFDWSSDVNLRTMKISASEILSQLYEQTGNESKAYTYLKIFKEVKNEEERLNNAANRSELEIQGVLRKRQQEIKLLESESNLKEQENKTQRIWLFSIAGALVSLVLLTFILVRNNRQKQKANKILESTLVNLKSTQSQLIQSEKMASLGELTAGIAHEIQNPLNFVNNFSEVNTELIDELKKELAVGNRQSAEEIANDIKSNSEKINHHGKRAGEIVKGMLQHSRTSSGQKELTDINALCDEYLRLSYHGYRAKDKSFNAKFETNFDPSLPRINIVPQDIGRVILNLITNAFYVVNEKKTLRQAQGDNGYEPTVSVSTKKVGDKVLITVKDNGNGIPEHIKEKIFQPFFTTKPTGQGTGLGLSLSYDIVKAHGGEIKVETKEGEGLPPGQGGTRFSIQLPF